MTAGQGELQAELLRGSPGRGKMAPGQPPPSPQSPAFPPEPGPSRLLRPPLPSAPAPAPPRGPGRAEAGAGRSRPAGAGTAGPARLGTARLGSVGLCRARQGRHRCRQSGAERRGHGEGAALRDPPGREPRHLQPRRAAGRHRHRAALGLAAVPR